MHCWAGHGGELIVLWMLLVLVIMVLVVLITLHMGDR